MEENKDELLQAFENPDMAEPTVETEVAPVENEYTEAPAYEAQPEAYVEPAPVQTEEVEETPEYKDVVASEVNFMPEEFQQALNQTDVTPEVLAEPAIEPVETQVEAEATVPVDDMQNVPENLNPEPVVSVKEDIKEESKVETDDDDMSYKKVLIFLAPIVLIMIAFILVLPLITKI